MIKKKLCKNYETLGLYITFLEASSSLGGNNPPRGIFSEHLFDIRNFGCRINRVLEILLFHLCHAQRTCSMSPTCLLRTGGTNISCGWKNKINLHVKLAREETYILDNVCTTTLLLC